MKEIVINSCYGGFSLSEEGVKHYAKLKGINLFVKKTGFFNNYWTIENPNIPHLEKEWAAMSNEQRTEQNNYFKDFTIDERGFMRDDPLLVQTVKDLKNKANGSYAKLKVVKIPDDVRWTIEEYDGNEHVAEVHETWG